MKIFKRKHKIKYEQVEGYLRMLTTKCNILKNYTMIGSIACSNCKHFVNQDYNKKIVICRKKQG